MIKTRYTAVVVAVVFIVTFAGGAVTYAQFSDTETATGSFTAGTTTPMVSFSSSSAKGLSFVAFCVEPDSSGSVTITNRTEKMGGDQIQINYTHTFDDNLTSVVNKAGPVLYEDNSSDGTVVSGEVNVVGRTGNNASGRQPSNPCGDSAVAIKFEEDMGEPEPNTTKSYGNSDVPSQANTGSSTSTGTRVQSFAAKMNGVLAGTSGGLSGGNKSDETNSADDSNATPTAAPTENQTSTENQTETDTENGTEQANGSNATPNNTVSNNTNTGTDANNNGTGIDTNDDGNPDGGDTISNTNSINNTAARNETTTNQTSAVAIHILGNSSSDNEQSDEEGQ